MTRLRDPASACYLCGGADLRIEAPCVRDNDAIQVLACKGCGLIFLSSFPRY